MVTGAVRTPRPGPGFGDRGRAAIGRYFYSSVFDLMDLIPRPTPKAALSFLHDLGMTAVAFVLALYLRVGNAAFGYYWGDLLHGLPIVLTVAAIAYWRFGLYQAMWRYVSLADLTQIIKAVTVAVLAFVLVMFLLTRLDGLPRSQPLIFWFVLTILISAPRFAFRMAKDRSLRSWRVGGEEGVPVVLIGAGNGTDTFLRWLNRESPAPYRVVGILAENTGTVGHSLHGIPVFGHVGALEAAGRWLKQRGLRPQRAILTEAVSAMDGALIREIFAWSEELGITLSRLPKPVEFKKASLDHRLEIHPVDVADLLHRPQAKLDESALGNLIFGRCVAITGAGGTIGSELARQVAAYGPSRLLLIDHSEFNLYRVDADLERDHPSVSRRPVICDIRNADRLGELFDTARPELVFHAAALKHVPLVEANPAEAVLTNCMGSRNVANAAMDCGARAMVLISTDKAVAPSSVMGATKRITERYCQALDVAGRSAAAADSRPATQFVTVRFGNVLGSSGSVVPLFQEQLAKGGPITVTDPEATRYFMTAREAVQLVLQASAHATDHLEEPGRILVLEMGDPVNIVDLARQMIRLQGLTPGKDVEIHFTGLRAGEKMHETLVDEDEEPVPTACAGVIAIQPGETDLNLMRQRLNALRTAALDGDAEAMQAIISALVPNFTGTVSTPTEPAAGSEPAADRKPAADSKPTADSKPVADSAPRPHDETGDAAHRKIRLVRG